MVRAYLYQASAWTLVILFSLKTIESLQNESATHFQVTPLFSMKTESQVSSHGWRKRALTASDLRHFIKEFSSFSLGFHFVALKRTIIFLFQFLLEHKMFQG